KSICWRQGPALLFSTHLNHKTPSFRKISIDHPQAILASALPKRPKQSKALRPVFSQKWKVSPPWDAKTWVDKRNCSQRQKNSQLSLVKTLSRIGLKFAQSITN